jgi:hypothetical protein
MNLKEMIDAIEENNRINSDYGASWKDWKEMYADNPEDVYGKFDGNFQHIERELLKMLIENEGARKEEFLDCMNILEYGQIFKR